jgi:hypothetical protein
MTFIHQTTKNNMKNWWWLRIFGVHHTDDKSEPGKSSVLPHNCKERRSH